MKPWKTIALCVAVGALALCVWMFWNDAGEKNAKNGAGIARMEDLSGISCFSASYIVEYRSWTKGKFWDGSCLRKDQVRLDYGVRLEDVSVKAIILDGRRVLKVRLPLSEILAVRVVSLEKSPAEISKNVPLDERGKAVNLDRIIDWKIGEIAKMHAEENLAQSRTCLTGFFEEMALKNGLKLDMEYVTTQQKKEENNEKTGHAAAGGDAVARCRTGRKADADAGLVPQH